MSVKTSSDITYTQQYGSHSSPLFVKLNPINNLQSANLSLTATYGPVEILLPAKCINLARSKLQFDVSLPAQTTSTYAWMQANGLCLFDRITLTSQNTNQVLCDISNFNRYASMLSPILTTQTEMQNKSSPSQTGFISATSIANAQVLPLEDLSRPNTSTNVDGNNVDYGTGYGICARKLLRSPAAAAVSFVSFEFDLSSIHASIFDVDKLIYASGEQLLLSVYFAPVNRWCFGSLGAADPSTDIAATGTFSFSNLSLYLYTENNLDISSSLVSKVMTEGMSLNFPYSYTQRQAVSSGSWSINQQLTRGYGSRLLFVATSIFNPVEINGTAQDHSVQHLATADGGSYSAFTYNTFIDNIPIQTNNNISVLSNGVAGAEHYLYNKYKIRNSAITSLVNYNVDFSHIDAFVEVPLAGTDWTVSDGLDLSAMHQWSIVSSSTAAAAVSNNVYIIFCCQKKLVFGPTGLQVV